MAVPTGLPDTTGARQFLQDAMYYMGGFVGAVTLALFQHLGFSTITALIIILVITIVMILCSMVKNTAADIRRGE